METVIVYSSQVEVDAVNPAGSQLGALRDVLSGWIDNPRQQRLLLLGEFGDGKSFACYRLTRSLARAYLDNPAAAHFPLRLPLRDLVQPETRKNSSPADCRPSRQT